VRRLGLLLLVLLTTASSPLPVHKQGDGNYWYPGELTWGEVDCTQLDASTPLTHNGVHTRCKNCTRTNPCACGGPGAEARTEDGQWKCESGLACADCISACVAPGGACTVTCDCCSGVCFMGICKDVITCADIGTTCNICPSIGACNLTSTIPASTTTTSTTTTASVSTTTGGGSTTTSTTLMFTSFGLLYTNNLGSGGADEYGAGGKTAATAPGTPVLMPVFGHLSHVPPQALRFSCIADQAPSVADPTCNNSSIPCPIWTISLTESNAPFDEANFSDTIASCTMNSIFPACTASNATVTFFTGQLLTFHAHFTAGGGGGGGLGPPHLRCTQEIGP
jgi:hypothetical protein